MEAESANHDEGEGYTLQIFLIPNLDLDLDFQFLEVTVLHTPKLLSLCTTS